MTFKELKQKSGMTQKQFADYFGIPKRTIEDWDRGTSKCAEYLLKLMEYKLQKEKIIKDTIHSEPIISKEQFEAIQEKLKN